MQRRSFLKSGAAALALARFPRYAEALADRAPRVGLIGTGWYGKADLLRLIQVAPVEVVSLSDVDAAMLKDAADLVASRQASKRTPRTYADYRKMLAEKDLDLVLIATPDHWHALAFIETVKAGADVYVQKPTSVDVVESQAMLAAARKYGRVVQVGTQRRSTPHLVEARDRFVRTGALGKVALVEIYCYYHMRTRENPPDSAPPPSLDWEAYTGPAPLRPYNRLVHPRGWRAFMEYGNGIVGDMCIHMLDAVRWMMGLGHAEAGQLDGRHPGGQGQQGEHQRHPDRDLRLRRSAGGLDPSDLGRSARPEVSLGHDLLRGEGDAQGQRDGLRLHTSRAEAPAVHRDVTYELEQFPEDKTEKDLERHVAPAIRGHMKDLLACQASRGRPVADIEEGVTSTIACILANLSMRLGRTPRMGPRGGAWWWATRRPTGCCAGPTGRPGSTRSRPRSDLAAGPPAGRRSAAEDPVLAPGRLVHQGGRREVSRHLRPPRDRRRRRASLVGEIVEGRRQAGFVRIAERMVEVVGHRAARHRAPRGCSAVFAGREAVRVVAEPLGVDALELDREVRGAAVVRGIEAVGLAAGGGADLDHLHADARAGR